MARKYAANAAFSLLCVVMYSNCEATTPSQALASSSPNGAALLSAQTSSASASASTSDIRSTDADAQSSPAPATTAPATTAPTSWVRPTSTAAPLRPSHPVYAPPPGALKKPLKVTISDVSAAKGASDSTAAPSDKVAASAFAEWLDDAPAKPQRGDATTLSSMQLRRDFYDAVQVAVQRSPDTQQALAQWEASRYDVASARGKRLPQVQLAGQTATKTFGGPRPINYPNDAAAVSLNATTTVFDWGAAKKVVQGSRQLATAAEQGYHATVESTALDVSNTLLELGRYRSFMAIGDDYVARMRALVDMLAQISAADQGRRSEWTQAKAQLLQAITDRDANAAQARQLEIKLSILLGDSYRVNLPSGSDWPIKPADTAALLRQFQEHPAIRQAKANAEAADFNAGAQRASKLPRLDWVVGKTVFQNAQGMQQPWGTSLQMTWPLFSGGSDSADYSAALARADASRQQIEVLKRNYEYQVRDSAQVAIDAFARADQYSDLSNTTTQVRKAMFEQWYQLGKRSLLDVLTSETDHYNDRMGEASSRFDAYEAVFSAYNGAGQLVGWLSSR